jgi:hypothetical protein
VAQEHHTLLIGFEAVSRLVNNMHTTLPCKANGSVGTLVRVLFLPPSGGCYTSVSLSTVMRLLEGLRKLQLLRVGLLLLAQSCRSLVGDQFRLLFISLSVSIFGLVHCCQSRLHRLVMILLMAPSVGQVCSTGWGRGCH